MRDKFESIFGLRYASEYMMKLFSQDNRYSTWRKLWCSLAKAEKKLGLPISDEQIKDLEENVHNIDYDNVAKWEKELKHDVMAHIHAYGEKAKKASGIIHLGATSCFVTDNADLIIMKDGLSYLIKELKNVIKLLFDFADKYKKLPILGYTHYQPAQLVTVGKRTTLWAQDLIFAYDEMTRALDNLRFLGSRGATGTEASFLDLFNGDSTKIDEMNKLIAADFGFNELFDVCGQTYPRIADTIIMQSLNLLAESSYKFATDIRLLQHDRFILEGFSKNQVGSSAMAYKRNPMKSERLCAISRFLMVDIINAPLTASTQWFERTLDDSANRRLYIPDAFLAADSIIKLLYDIISNLCVNEKVIEKAVKVNMPYIATENIIMECVKKGKDRQKIHEIIRELTINDQKNIEDGNDSKMIELLLSSEELNLTDNDLKDILDENKYIGRSIEQVEMFIHKNVDKIN